MTEQEWLNNNDLSLTIYNKKYRNGNETFEEFLDRVSANNASVKALIKDKKFIFGGRILSSRGITDRKVTYSNCYVIAPPEDNIESIFDCCKKLARTYSYGGGCGIDISKLRPNGALVHNAAKSTCGPVGFMDLFSQTTNTIGQAGRRGALMISLDVRHPDVEEFIDCKTDLNRVQYANISVRVSDDFMQAVEKDEDYILHWPCNMTISKKEAEALDYNILTFVETVSGPVYLKKVKAKDLFNKLAKNNWDYAEPGMLFWDRIENYNIINNDPDFKYAGTNPCAEEPLPAGGSCLLGSLNLSEFVLFPFTDKARIDWDSLEESTRLAIRALNLVLIEGVTLHPLEEQQNSVSQWRQIGLGTMGLADMLIKLGIKYGSGESLEIINKVYAFIAVESVLESLDMAKEYGCYPACKKELLVESNFIKHLNLTEKTIKDIKKYGLYNSQLLTCAPTGSIGTMFGCSTGIEPQFALKYTRKTQSLEGKDTYFQVNAKIVDDYIEITGSETLPDYFITSAEIKPLDRVKTQATLQKWIDASISSTVNLPKEATVEQVFDIYMNAWKYNLKGITIYRSGCKREAILATESIKPIEIPTTKAPKRPKDLPADFYTVMSKGKQYIVIVGLLNDKPYEVFAFQPNIKLGVTSHRGVITKKAKMHYCFISDQIEINELQLSNENVEEKAATLYASMLLRHGVEIKYIIKTAKKVNDNITSFSSALCRILNKYIPSEVTGEKCPECGGDLINEGGCKHCNSCGYSKCMILKTKNYIK